MIEPRPWVNYDDGYYEGEKNEQGHREGKGVCIWLDGTTYMGAWSDGKMHGDGILSKPKVETF